MVRNFAKIKCNPQRMSNNLELEQFYDQYYQQLDKRLLFPASKQTIIQNQVPSRCYLFEESNKNFEKILKSFGYSRNKLQTQFVQLDGCYTGVQQHLKKFTFLVGLNIEKKMFARIVRIKRSEEQENNQIHLIHFYNCFQNIEENNMDQVKEEEEDEEINFFPYKKHQNNDEKCNQFEDDDQTESLGNQNQYNPQPNHLKNENFQDQMKYESDSEEQDNNNQQPYQERNENVVVKFQAKMIYLLQNLNINLNSQQQLQYVQQIEAEIEQFKQRISPNIF